MFGTTQSIRGRSGRGCLKGRLQGGFIFLEVCTWTIQDQNAFFRIHQYAFLLLERQVKKLIDGINHEFK